MGDKGGVVVVGGGVAGLGAAVAAAGEAEAMLHFDDDPAREGGHSRRRVVHAGGAETGLECLVFGRRGGLAAVSDPGPFGHVPGTVPRTGPDGTWSGRRSSVFRPELVRSGHVQGTVPGTRPEETVTPEFRRALWEDDGFAGYVVPEPGCEPRIERWS